MSDGGKGSAPRPIQNRDQFGSNWDRIFNTCKDCGKSLAPDSVHTCSPQAVALMTMARLGQEIEQEGKQ